MPMEQQKKTRGGSLEGNSSLHIKGNSYDYPNSKHIGFVQNGN